ncbi:hypothetical protein BU16DRAFT_535288 [Lophium mytilinum]|uniref:BTB domain-containing protein n=1 Tax=Lophium mytilinum TaxID=390894 RepID=A0A6A6R8L1_9PEZI|nr:hypothetical protein BU16DRAFT_535288 [Lophium mytilinum]
MVAVMEPVPDGSPSFRDLHRTLITVNVGPDAEPYLIYKELICHYSPHFRAIFNSERWKEGESGIVPLPDVSVRVFAHFHQWLETQSLDHVKDHLDLLDLYIFADSELVNSLQNGIIDKIHERRVVEVTKRMARAENFFDGWTGDAFADMDSPAFSPASSLDHLDRRIRLNSKIIQYFMDCLVYGINYLHLTTFNHVLMYRLPLAYLPIAKVGSEESIIEELPDGMLGAVFIAIVELVRESHAANVVKSSLLNDAITEEFSQLSREALTPMILILLSVLKGTYKSDDPTKHKAFEKHDLCSYHTHKDHLELAKCAHAFQESWRGKGHKVWSEWRRVKKAHDLHARRGFVRAEL